MDVICSIANDRLLIVLRSDWNEGVTQGLAEEWPEVIYFFADLETTIYQN